jgi:hypothetical protein
MKLRKPAKALLLQVAWQDEAELQSSGSAKSSKLVTKTK